MPILGRYPKALSSFLIKFSNKITTHFKYCFVCTGGAKIKLKCGFFFFLETMMEIKSCVLNCLFSNIFSLNDEKEGNLENCINLCS